MFKDSLLFYLKYYFYWIVIFFVGRVAFMYLYAPNLADFSFAQKVESLMAGFRLDLSAASFIILIPLVVLFFGFLVFGNKSALIYRKFVLFWTFLVTILYFAILGGESGLYAEWNTKLNFKAIHHLVDPKEVMQTASMGDTFMFVAYILLGVISFWIFKKCLFHNPFKIAPNGLIRKISIFFFAFGLFAISVILMRGGLQQIPINTSDAYFSNEDILNDIAVNPLWNIGQSIEQNRRSMQGNPYEINGAFNTKEIVQDLYNYPDTSNQFILKNKRPNLVFILLEGWSEDLISEYKELTPQFNDLINNGYYFNNFYSNGWTSDQGMCAILSAAPVFPHTSVVNQTDKSRNVPGVYKTLKKQGYSSMFYFGGQLSYGNIKGYLLNQNIDVLKEEKDFKDAKHRGKLGVHDDYMFQKYLEGINQLKEPFVTSLFTMSTHAPYDINHKKPLDYGGEHKEYLQSAMFADSCIGDFIKKAKDEPWFDNTLFVFVADHGHNTPVKKYKENFFERNRIPMLLYGNVLVDSIRGKQNKTLGSHIDISKTLLTQFELPPDKFIWSKNILDSEVPEFFPYVFHYGLGLKTNHGNYRYILTVDKEKFYTQKDSILIRNQCRSYFKETYENFMGL